MTPHKDRHPPHVSDSYTPIFGMYGDSYTPIFSMYGDSYTPIFGMYSDSYILIFTPRMSATAMYRSFHVKYILFIALLFHVQ